MRSEEQCARSGERNVLSGSERKVRRNQSRNRETDPEVTIWLIVQHIFVDNSKRLQLIPYLPPKLRREKVQVYFIEILDYSVTIV